MSENKQQQQLCDTQLCVYVHLVQGALDAQLKICRSAQTLEQSWPSCKSDNLSTSAQGRGWERPATEGLLGKTQPRQLPFSLMLMYRAFVCISYFSDRLPAMCTGFWSDQDQNSADRCFQKQLFEEEPITMPKFTWKRKGRSSSKFVQTTTHFPNTENTMLMTNGITWWKFSTYCVWQCRESCAMEKTQCSQGWLILLWITTHSEIWPAHIRNNTTNFTILFQAQCGLPF